MSDPRDMPDINLDSDLYIVAGAGVSANVSANAIHPHGILQLQTFQMLTRKVPRVILLN